MSRLSILVLLSALGMALPSTSHAAEEGPILCEVVKAFGAFTSLVDAGGDDGLQNEDDEWYCPRSVPSPNPSPSPSPRPGTPANPPGWNPGPGQFEALN